MEVYDLLTPYLRHYLEARRQGARRTPRASLPEDPTVYTKWDP
jgi:hypothetical protein